MTVRIAGAALASVLRGPNGPVARRLIEDGEMVKNEAKRLVGVHQPRPGERRKRKPGTLRDSIVKRFESTGPGGFQVVVGSKDPIALWHHEGTQAHEIPKGRVVKVLRFPSNQSKWKGGIAYIPASRQPIHHPGTSPNRYLRDALRVLHGRYS